MVGIRVRMALALVGVSTMVAAISFLAGSTPRNRPVFVGTPAASARVLGNRPGPASSNPGPGAVSPSPAASPAVSPSPDASPAVSPSPDASPAVSPSPDASPAVSPSPAASPTPSPAASCSAPLTAPVRQAPGTGRTVALTFDDGPDTDTPAMLEALHAAGVHATFFVIGSRAAAHPELVTRTAAEGHLVGNHSWSHRYPRAVAGGWTAAYLREELTRTRDLVSSLTGAPVCWFRPPGGNMPAAVMPTSIALRFDVALWSVDPWDWQLQGLGRRMRTSQITDLIVSRVSLGLAEQHPVILMHDGGGFRGATVAAVPKIIAIYRAHGYRFVRLDGAS